MLSLLLPQAPSLYSTTTVNTHVDLSPSERPQPKYVLAMHAYVPDQRNATCLAFCAGQVIRILNHDLSGWWDGELDGSQVVRLSIRQKVLHTVSLLM
jgi:son of sevenless-like protein